MYHRSEGTFGIPQCTARYMRLLRIHSCVNSGTLQKNKSLPELQSPQNRKPFIAPAADNFHCVTHPNLSLELVTFAASRDAFNGEIGEPLKSDFSLPGTGRPEAAHAVTTFSPPAPLELPSPGLRRGQPEAPGPLPAGRRLVARPRGGKRSRGML